MGGSVKGQEAVEGGRGVPHGAMSLGSGQGLDPSSLSCMYIVGKTGDSDLMQGTYTEAYHGGSTTLIHKTVKSIN